MKNISVTGRLYSGTFGERSLVHQIFLEFWRSLTSGGFFLQLIDKAPNLCNVLYLTEVIDFFWPIYISIADCHFQPEEWPVVLGWIPVLLWRSGLTYMEPCKTKKLGVGTSFSPQWPLQHSAHYCYHLSWQRDSSWTERGRKDGVVSMAITFKSSSGVPQWLSMEGKRISCGDRVGLGEEGALQWW